MPLIAALLELVEKYPRYGFGKYFSLLRRSGRKWNHKRILRVYRQLDLHLRRKRKRRLPTRAPVRLEAQARVIRVLERVAAWRGYPAKLRMDNGPECVSVLLADWAERHGVKLEFIQPGKPTQNSYVERFNRTFREEVLNFYVFNRLSDVRSITDTWIKEYNEERPHESLGNLTPEEFALTRAEFSSFDLH